jgi:8-oxo-dGTP pyrophosphatase MutT (NUDIX family)
LKGKECLVSFNLFRKVKLSPDYVQHQLSKGLPGPSAQWVMAPADRPQQPISLEGYTRSAVLILLLFRGGSPEIVFIRRASYEGVHSGQIGFPGGKFEPNEHSATEVALREANEETGIKGNEVDVLGTLSPLYIPVSKMRVEPVLAVSEMLPQFNRNEREVEEIIIKPIDFFINANNLIAYPLRHNSGKLRTVPAFNVQPVPIWGATAMMMSELLTLIYEAHWLNVAQSNFNEDEQKNTSPKNKRNKT